MVDVWRVDLSRPTHDGLAELLCAQERARAEEITDTRRRAMWTRSRGALRLLLARYLDADPRELRFVLGDHGKPRLESEQPQTWREGGSGPCEDLRFNLSHSGELMLLAVTDGREVGVDVERARERYTTEFLRAWTMREARVKCLGSGLASAPSTSDDAQEMWTTELDVGPRASAAIAVEGAEECELHQREWPD